LGYLATQVVKGLGKDSSRVSKVLLQSDHASSVKQSRDAFYDFQSLKLTNTEALSQISKGRSGLFLRDPNGNFILFYPLKKAGKPMLNDLKHLLRLSNIG
jgi:cytochrome oxidase Cu insertion factor (SCO1/SenC/PrrC family)